MRVALGPRLRVSLRDDGGVILNPDNGQMFTLNSVGARMVGLIQQQLPLDEICARIGQDFSVPAQRVRADLDALLGQLRGAGLL